MSEYLSRVANLVAGVPDSVNASIELGLQAKGKVSLGPLKGEAAAGVFNFSVGTSAASTSARAVRD